MADEAHRPVTGSSWLETLRLRLYGRLLLLLAVALVFMTMAGLHVVDPWLALLAYAAVVAVAALVPDTGEPGTGAAPGTSTGEIAFADAVRHFADALPDPCIVLDRRSVIVHLNPEARRHFPGVASGNPIAFTLRSPPLLAAIEAARLGASQAIELHQTVPTETWYKATVAPLAAGDPVNDGVLVITLQSLTEEKRLEALRTDFIANASHELRTPLTSLVGFIDTLLGPAANDKAARERFLGLMRGQAARMSQADRGPAVAEPHRDAPAHAAHRPGRAGRRCCAKWPRGCISWPKTPTPSSSFEAARPSRSSSAAIATSSTRCSRT
jgi:two-component system phosphate regulon sensor histidine kinase PhoR